MVVGGQVLVRRLGVSYLLLYQIFEIFAIKGTFETAAKPQSLIDIF
jgi:hypothetical protein